MAQLSMEATARPWTNTKIIEMQEKTNPFRGWMNP
jgi:hypothetical protein